MANLQDGLRIHRYLGARQRHDIQLETWTASSLFPYFLIVLEDMYMDPSAAVVQSDEYKYNSFRTNEQMFKKMILR
ncbi:hypothetical protein IHE45_16G072400 [Dioscorea alata]|uniref:Uncharacterized protein n=1 Tax=Dioscorea alata TaxID=55571 RepID=A0ACB7UIL7_DIOAL|nr:hypothetical protein IHE45_16G072400 [Dioscorea alata]